LPVARRFEKKLALDCKKFVGAGDFALCVRKLGETPGLDWGGRSRTPYRAICIGLVVFSELTWQRPSRPFVSIWWFWAL